MRSLVLLLLGGCVTLAAHAADRNFDRRVSADPRGLVEISNVAGRIEVSGWDNPEVEVHGELGAGADRIDVESDSGRTTIKVVVPNHSFRTISTILRVKVPRESELDISGVSADVESAEVQGALQLKTVSGDVKADVYQGNTEIKTVSGDVTLRGRSGGQSQGQAPGTSLHVTTISGNLKAEHLAGELDATTISGDLTLQMGTMRSVRVRTTSGNMSFEGKLARGGVIDSESVSGDFTVRAVPEGGMDYEVATFSGDIKGCMEGGTETTNRHGPGKRLTGSVGGNGADAGRVRLKTMSGDVELCHRS